jgi:Fic family protein
MDSLIKAHTLKSELDSLRPIRFEQEQRIMQKFRLDWNYHSNNLEGNSLSYGETKALLLFGITAQGKPLKDHFEITGHNEAILWIEEVVKNERPLNDTFIRELHSLLLKEPYQVDAITPEGAPTKKWVQVGQYKTTPNHVKTKTGEIFRFATPQETPALMEDLLNWYKLEKEKGDVDQILLAIEFHYRFIRIHPFDDGNGRTARILMNFILMLFGYPPVIIHTEDKATYISTLEQADAGIMEPFVNYIVMNLINSLEIIIRGAKGESIEEMDDVDKEIMMLDIKLRSIGSKIEKIKSVEVLKEFYDKSLIKLIDSFIECSNLFNKFFNQKKIIVTTDRLIWSEVNINSLSNTILSALNNNPSYLKITILFDQLNYVGVEDFSMGMNLIINFERSMLEISSENFSKRMLYSEQIYEEDLSELKRQIKLSGKKNIEELISKKNQKLKE